MIENLDQSWQRLEVRHLSALAAVARHASFRAAARTLGYSQSAISAQIAVLESIVGTPVLDRPRSGGVSLTAAGRILLEHAERAATELAAGRAAIQSLATGRDQLRVGVFQSVASAILPPILRALRQEWPLLDVECVEAVDPLELEERVVRGDLDVAFAGLPHDERLKSLVLREDPYVALVAADHPLAGASHVAVEALSDVPVIAYRTVAPHLYAPAERIAPGAIVFRTDDDAVIRALVASGVGVAVVPILSVNADDRRTRALPIEPPFPPRTITLVWRDTATPSPALAAFLSIARDGANVRNGDKTG